MALIEAAGLGLRGKRGWVFHDVNLSLGAGCLGVVVGPAGSGRSMLLLALAGRARPTTGSLVVAGSADRRAIRRTVAVARVTGAVEPEPDLRVADARREAALLSRVPGAAVTVAWAENLLGLAVSPRQVVGDLAPDDGALLALALAAATRPGAVVLDDVDADATPAQQTRIWSGLAALAEAGITTVATAADDTHAGGATVHRLGEVPGALV